MTKTKQEGLHNPRFWFLVWYRWLQNTLFQTLFEIYQWFCKAISISVTTFQMPYTLAQGSNQWNNISSCAKLEANQKLSFKILKPFWVIGLWLYCVVKSYISLLYSTSWLKCHLNDDIGDLLHLFVSNFIPKLNIPNA